MDSEITLFGQTNFRNKNVKFGIKSDDRRRHFYIIGQTGTGKTTMMKNMAYADIQKGRGLAIIDPHGEFADRMLDDIPEERIKDVVYFNPADTDWPIAFNVMESVPAEYRYLIASGLVGVFKKIWPDVWSARMEYILNNVLLALLEYPDATLLGINRLLSDKDYRRVVVNNITDPIVKNFWVSEFAHYHDRYMSEAIAPIQNKAGQFISNPLIRNIIGQKESKIDMRQIMDEQKILIVNLSKGLIGEDNSALLGALMITKLQQAAMSRVDVPEEERKDFYLYVDEFQNFSTESFVNILSEARKYRLNLILAHQYIAQLTEAVRDAVIGNVGTIVAFRVGADDAEFLEKSFMPSFTAEDLINLPNFHFCIKLMINGFAGQPFSGINIPPFPPPLQSYRQQIIALNRQNLSCPSNEIKTEIAHWASLDFSKIGIEESETTGFKAVCDLCGKSITIPFQPDGARPIYCRECLEKVKKGIVSPAKKTKNKIPSQEKFVSIKDFSQKQVSIKSKKINKEEIEETVKEVLEKQLENDNPN